MRGYTAISPPNSAFRGRADWRTYRHALYSSPEYRNADALRGIEGSPVAHLVFGSRARRLVTDCAPAQAGRNKRIGVFATRSPFRPNEIGLSSVRLDRVEPNTPDGPVLHISGADLMDGTPIFDIKPYLAYTDSHPEALGGFALTTDAVRVECPQACSKSCRRSAVRRC